MWRARGSPGGRGPSADGTARATAAGRWAQPEQARDEGGLGGGWGMKLADRVAVVTGGARGLGGAGAARVSAEGATGAVLGPGGAASGETAGGGGGDGGACREGAPGSLEAAGGGGPRA